MTPPITPDGIDLPLRVGIPWRTTEEERAGSRQKLDYYFACVRRAGAEPAAVSLEQSPAQLAGQLSHLDGFVLPGSPSDVDPARYGAARHPQADRADSLRDATDAAILEHAFAHIKPVLAICYGCQALNVFLGGTLLQDIPSDRPGGLVHGKTDLAATAHSGDLEHEAQLAPGSRLASLNGSDHATINTSHHQAIDQPGKNLRVTAKAPDGIIEGVEWQGEGPWAVGVQWHPERMAGDRFSERLFADFVAAVRSARGAIAHTR
ncbi:MAG: gamma-glutamyl-gamma-aminobutyrate hydrolase family protein [Candidatus Acidiferrum sp.]|jgi:putative glutamine amidotransferase